MSPKRLMLPLLGGGVLLLLVLLVLGLAGSRVMPSYLAAWQFALSVPVGALLLVTGIEAFAPGLERDGATPRSGPLLTALRALLPLLPVVALFGLPVLLLSPSLYHVAAWPADGIGRIWEARGLFSLRLVLFLLIWSALALLFAAPPPEAGRSGLAVLGFGLTLVIGTLAAVDWIMAVEPGLASSSFGLLVLSGEAVSAVAVAGLLLPSRESGIVAVPLLMLLSVWLFLNFTQFLSIWSANKPDEAGWYVARTGGLGAAGLWFAIAVIVAALALLTRPGGARFVAPVAGLVLLARLIESFWLITPAFRGGFTFTFADLLAILGLAALLAGVQIGGWLPSANRMRHVRA